MKTIIRHSAAALLGASLIFGANLVGAEEPPAEQPAQVDLSGVVDAGALGETEQATDDLLTGLKVTKIQVTAFTSTDEHTGTRALFQSSTSASFEDADKAALLGAQVKVTPPEGAGEEGFDFAGSSTQLDTTSLQYGFALGSIVLILEASPDDAKATIAELGGFGALDKVYDPEVQKHLTAYKKALAEGKIDGDAYTNLLQSCTQAIGRAGDSSGERLHGYMLTGLWISMAAIAAHTNTSTSVVADTGKSIVMMLEKDASYGGSDRAIAIAVRGIVKELEKDKPALSVVLEKSQKAFAAKADK